MQAQAYDKARWRPAGKEARDDEDWVYARVLCGGGGRGACERVNTHVPRAVLMAEEGAAHSQRRRLLKASMARSVPAQILALARRHTVVDLGVPHDEGARVEPDGGQRAALR